MKYEFDKHVGFTTFNAEGKEKMFQRMCDVLDWTGVEVNFNILPKKDRYFLCPVGAIKMVGSDLVVSKVSAFSRSKMELQFSKNLMIQIIKKALKNKMRIKDTTNQETR